MSQSWLPPAPLGYQVDPPPSSPVPSEAPETLARRIDAAIAAVPADKRGTLLLATERSGASATVMIRAGQNISILARVTMPATGGLDYGAYVRVNFSVMQVRPIVTRELYDALRAERDGLKRNSRFRAFVKAFAARRFGARPYLDGSRWFDRSPKVSA